MAALGHEVHVISSTLQVYGNLPNYDETYGKFLGPREAPVGSQQIDGYLLHRLPYRLMLGYVDLQGLLPKVIALKPDIVQIISCVSSNALKLALGRWLGGFRLFTECHQHLSVMKPFLLQGGGGAQRLVYAATRTLPGLLISLCTDKCFPIAPDCAAVANRFYGVQARKLETVPLGTDTDAFFPVADEATLRGRTALRETLGVAEAEILCIYTGRFSCDKNPLILAQTISRLSGLGLPFRGIFVGDGVQRGEIEGCGGCSVVPFVQHRELPAWYRAADIGIWPTQESTSMLDAASCGLPIVVSDRMGDANRIEGTGRSYQEGNPDDLAAVLQGLASREIRLELGVKARSKIVRDYSWIKSAQMMLAHYGTTA